MSDIAIEERPICRLPEAWSVVDLESGALYQLGGNGAAMVWRHKLEAEEAAERLGDRYTAIRVSTS